MSLFLHFVCCEITLKGVENLFFFSIFHTKSAFFQLMTK